MYNFEEESFSVSYKRPVERTLGEDFSGWWKMKRYSGSDIEAKKFSNEEIRTRHGGGAGWPGSPEDGVTYWVELRNGMAVGYAEKVRGKATFPIAEMNV